MDEEDEDDETSDGSEVDVVQCYQYDVSASDPKGGLRAKSEQCISTDCVGSVSPEVQ